MPVEDLAVHVAIPLPQRPLWNALDGYKADKAVPERVQVPLEPQPLWRSLQVVKQSPFRNLGPGCGSRAVTRAVNTQQPFLGMDWSEASGRSLIGTARRPTWASSLLGPATSVKS